VTYEDDVTAKLSIGELLTNRRTSVHGSRQNIDVEEFEIVSVAGQVVGMLTVREETDPNPPFFTQRTVTRSDK
jgi:hypothetical protein